MKKFTIVMAALLSVSLVLVGCGDPEAGAAGSAGSAGSTLGHYEGKVSVQVLRDAVAKGVMIQLDNVEITGAGTLDFGTADVTVYGTLATSDDVDVLVIVAGESVKLAEDASIAPDDGDYFIGTQTHVDAAGNAQVGLAVGADGLDALSVGGVTGVATLTLTEGEATPAWYAYSLKVFVYGTLTISGNATPPTTATVTAIKDVVIEAPANPTDTITTLNESNKAKVDVSAATIAYTGTGTVKVALPTALSSPAFSVTGNNGVLEVSGSTTVNARVGPGNGYVEFAGAVTQATITGGGRVRFKNGTTATGFTTAGSSITASVIEFTNGLSTAESAPLTLSGAVYIPDEKAITFGHSNGTLTLTKGSAVYAGTPGGTGTAKVLEATTNAVLTPVANAALTVAVSAKKLTLGTAGLTLTSGTLAVAAGATLVGDDLTVKGTLVADGTVKTSGGTNSVAITKATVVGDETTGAVFAVAGTLTLAATDQLVLADEGTIVVAGTGSVALPNSTFGAGTYTAAGAVTITAATDGDTIVTSTTADEGLVIGAASTALSLLGQGSTAATYTLKKADTKGVVFGNGASAITVGNGTTSEESSLTASEKAKIVLGTSTNASDAIGLGNASTLVLKTGATIGVFTNSPVTLGPDKIGATLGGAALTKDTASLVNSEGTLTTTTANATLTGASDGSSIVAGAAFAAGT